MPARASSDYMVPVLRLLRPLHGALLGGLPGEARQWNEGGVLTEDVTDRLAQALR
eukprot:CAMPEP_0195113144 /NCGR_PEP_ID=MMETSP0448-20130528/101411_1 /TAXON_ID=66468 /ORGANISM="Heterocapsa triquestra, Strain CCMP 448" /LENGTH=54 /DNA_ID=CAMNT_0040150049 /DNA_START=241 /DNA_END=402 /DNA_ORIENTATION=+